MSVKSVLVTVVAVISISAGLFPLPLPAKGDLPFNWVRNLNSTTWGYTEAEDPSAYGSVGVVERFELRMGDCNRNEYEDDCNSSQERIELVEFTRPVMPLNGEFWYRWKMYFPENYTIIYPAKTYHLRFFEKGEKLTWSFEIGSTGVFWLGSYASDETKYYPLVDEEELLSQWYEFSVHAKWRPDSGFFKVWVNNIEKVDYVGPTCRDCRMRLGYGIIRSGLEKYYQSYPNNKLPTQVIYYTGPERSTSGNGYPGYIPVQNTDSSILNSSPKALNPVLIIETKNQKISDAHKNEEDRRDAEIINED